MSTWNKGQQEVLNSLEEEKNILVSAAAGSGKTAVLVERIIRTVLEGRADIDEILVVTFTRAAAAQMKAKIIAALEKKVSEEPNSDMARQLLLAQNADIMTIDSFCSKIVRENFSQIGIDPAFDLYENEEIILLKDEVLDSVLEKHFAEDECFRSISRFFMRKNIDTSNIKDIILKINNVSDSFADPLKWLNSAASESEELESTGESLWIKNYRNIIKDNAVFFSDILQNRAEVWREELADKNSELAVKLYDLYTGDAMILRTISEQDTLSDIVSKVPSRWSSFPKKQFLEVYDENILKKVTAERDNIKEAFKGIYVEDELKAEVLDNREYVKDFIDIVIDFRDELMKEKNKNRKYEFSDISHGAYSILYDSDMNCPSQVGKRMSEIYKYIYIDEYQDSNDLQENVINCVARHDSEGRINNVFMVGDIKQSIYGFRLARPELFAEKADSYGQGEGGKLITLNMNYRSREAVLEATNFIFEKIMKRDFGGVDYDDESALHIPDMDSYRDNFPGPETDDNILLIPELIMIDSNDIEGEETELSSEETESVVIGRKILEMVYGDPEKGIKPLQVRNENYNKEKPDAGENLPYRPVRFGDIVILLRKVRGITEMLRTYEQMGIPVLLDDQSGYFDAIEIITLISTLRVIDNIQQDIPLASVLLSPIGGFTDNELAHIVSLSDERYISLADKLQIFIEGDHGSAEAELAEKTVRIMNMINAWMEIKPFIDIAGIIDRILADTGYIEYAASMPDGGRRVANIKMLKVKADHFESVRGGGLLDFLRYIDKCKFHDIDFGEASAQENVTDSVHIMSIHKSKGLEFPVVIAGRLGQKFMLSDMSGRVVADSDYMIAMDVFKKLDNQVMVKKRSLKKIVLQILNNKAVRAEEARLLYVAMTRAKEKLIMTGTFATDAPIIPYDAKSMLDYIRLAIDRESGNGASDVIDIKEVTKYDVSQIFEKSFEKKSLDYKRDMSRLLEDIQNQAALMDEEDSESPYTYLYPYREVTEFRSKLSVSEIKHREMERNLELIQEPEEGDIVQSVSASLKAVSESSEDVSEKLKAVSEGSKDISEEMKDVSIAVKDESEGVKDESESVKDEAEESRKKAASRGTIIHSLFEKMDYSKVDSRNALIEEFGRVLAGKEYKDEDRALVNIKSLSMFFNDKADSLFMRMKQAALNGKLLREQQFIAGLKSCEIPGRQVSPDLPEEDSDMTIIQGIIDAFFYEGEDDHIILVDYKTDNVKDGDELLDRYASQMYLYALTLEKLTGKTVKDVVLYSTRFGEVHYSEWREYLKRNEVKAN